MELKLEKLLNYYKELLEIPYDIKIEFTDFKTKIASISFKTKVLRLNRKILHKLNKKHLKYIILHELAHLKTEIKTHPYEFYDFLGKFYSKDEIKKIEEEINFIFYSVYLKL